MNILHKIINENRLRFKYRDLLIAIARLSLASMLNQGMILKKAISVLILLNLLGFEVKFDGNLRKTLHLKVRCFVELLI